MNIFSKTVLCCAMLATSASAEVIVGFDSKSSEQQRAVESRYDDMLDAAKMDAWLQRMSASPHHVGSRGSREVAEYAAGLLEEWGYETDVAEYRILLPTPVTRELELLSPGTFQATLQEDVLSEDPSTEARGELLPPYNAFSVDGEVEGELVFVNYGIPEDYELLERYGIDVKGKVVIAKYGRSWRGIKPKLAGEKGAVATIIYSDPADDGYAVGDVYPKGAYKHESGVQRGSVMDMPTYPGDVLTPGIGATRNAKRIRREEAPTITKIPVLPISHRDALPLLAAMDGPVAPKEWRGALPITYHLGPGPARVRLKLEFAWDTVSAYNVIARLDGEQYPEEWVLRGNHHDGWNHGAADPLSGLVAMLAEARAVAALAAAGEKPARSIVYAAWDAEEPGLIGSTEWAEHHADRLRKHAVTYLNTDGNSRGFAYIGGSHTLERFFNQILDEVADPRLGISLKARRLAHDQLHADDEQAKQDATERADLRIYPLGSGSDYTPFLQHLGIASANMSFGGEGNGGSYHTLYDTYEHYTRFRDPALTYGVTLAKVAGRATLRFANASRLPLEFTGFADNVALYVRELEQLAEDMRAQTEETNSRIEEGIYTAALDPDRSLGPPLVKPAVPHFNFAPLHNALERLQAASASYQSSVASGARATPEINRMLAATERLMTREHGLPGRAWYKHHLYAPGFYTGYGVKTIPGVREAIEQREYTHVDKQIAIAADVLDSVSAQLEKIVQLQSR